MVTYSSPYPGSVPHDDKWGATVGPRTVMYSFCFQDGTADGWTADDGVTQLTDLDWPGEITVQSTGEVGPFGYAMRIVESVAGDFGNSVAYGGCQTPRFPVSPGDLVSSVFMFHSENVAGYDNKVIHESAYLNSWHALGSSGYYDTYVYEANRTTYSKIASTYEILRAPYEAVSGMAVATRNFVVVDPFANEAAVQYGLYGRTVLMPATADLPMRARILGAVIKVESP